MTELRQRFERHMTLHRLSPKTHAAYMNAVKSLAGHYRQPPDWLTDTQVQDYLDYIIADRQLKWSTCNVQFSGIKRLYPIQILWGLEKQDTRLIVNAG